MRYGGGGSSENPDVAVGLTLSASKGGTVATADSSAFTMPRVRGEAIQVIRNLIRTCETMRPVADERVLSLRLFYSDDAPSDYQPGAEGDFIDASEETLVFFKAPPLAASLGKVSTQSHTFSVRAAWKEEGDEECWEEKGEEGEEDVGAATAAVARPAAAARAPASVRVPTLDPVRAPTPAPPNTTTTTTPTSTPPSPTASTPTSSTQHNATASAPRG